MALYPVNVTFMDRQALSANHLAVNVSVNPMLLEDSVMLVEQVCLCFRNKSVIFQTNKAAVLRTKKKK